MGEKQNATSEPQAYQLHLVLQQLTEVVKENYQRFSNRLDNALFEQSFLDLMQKM